MKAFQVRFFWNQHWRLSPLIFDSILLPATFEFIRRAVHFHSHCAKCRSRPFIIHFYLRGPFSSGWLSLLVSHYSEYQSLFSFLLWIWGQKSWLIWADRVYLAQRDFLFAQSIQHQIWLHIWLFCFFLEGLFRRGVFHPQFSYWRGCTSNHHF